MSSEAPSNTTASLSEQGSSNKRTRIAFGPLPSSGTTTDPRRFKTPLEAATAVGQAHLRTLHPSLPPLLEDHFKRLVQAHASHQHKTKKHQEMLLDPAFVPKSVRNMGLTLQALNEVRESENNQALNVRLASRLEEFRHELTRDFILPNDDMNRLALHERSTKAYCTLLFSAARGFIAQFNVKQYSEHQAVVDFIATFPDEVTSPHNVTVIDLLKSFKKTAELTALPMPSTGIEHSLAEVINSINGTTSSANNNSDEVEQEMALAAAEGQAARHYHLIPCQSVLSVRESFLPSLWE